MVESICDKCVNVIRWTETTEDDVYSYKRKGIKYNKEAKCIMSGRFLYSWIEIVKCSHFKEK